MKQNIPRTSGPHVLLRTSGPHVLPSVLLPDQKELLLANHEEFWLSSQFDVPFVQTYIPPDYYRHNFIMLNFLKPEQIKEMRAWINGKEVGVNRYNYWRGGAGSFVYYLDGTRSSLRSGKNTLALWVSSN